MNNSIINIPNSISAIRLVLAFPISYSILQSQLTMTLILGSIAVISDFADGYASRVFNQVSPFGKIIDPIVDCILVLSVMLALVIKQLIPLWYLMLIMVRYLMITILLYRYKLQSNNNPQSITSGKISMCVIALVILSAVLNEWFGTMHQVLIVISTNLLIISAYDYYLTYIKNNKLVGSKN